MTEAMRATEKSKVDLKETEHEAAQKIANDVAATTDTVERQWSANEERLTSALSGMSGVTLVDEVE